MKNSISKIAAIIVAIAIMVVSVNSSQVTAKTKKKPKLNKKSVTLTITNKNKSPAVTLKVKNAGSKKASWKSSNKKVATIKVTGKYNAKITAKKAGKANITCRVNGKKLVCKITVNDGSTKCNHKWAEKWNVYEIEKECTGAEAVCYCGFAGTLEESYQHDIDASRVIPSSNKMKLATKVTGLHGTKAKGEATLKCSSNGDILISKREYIEYLYCTKCGKKNSAWWDLPAAWEKKWNK